MERIIVYSLKEPVITLLEKLRARLNKCSKRAIFGEFYDLIFTSKSPFFGGSEAFAETDNFFNFKLQVFQCLPSGVTLYIGEVEIAFDKTNNLLIVDIENKFLEEDKTMSYLNCFINFKISHVQYFNSYADFSLCYSLYNTKKPEAA